MTDSPRQNRVLPTGEIVALAARGLFTGNRGVLHDAAGRIGQAHWRHKHWICCTLQHPKGLKRQVMTPGRWTELFFLDEAVALAAGHRPCAYCRRPAFLAFQKAWQRAGLGPAAAPAMDSVLHTSRVTRTRAQVAHQAEAGALPEGSIIALPAPHLLWQDRALPFAPEGYGPPRAWPSGPVTTLTPAPILEVLRAGYRPAIHPSAG